MWWAILVLAFLIVGHFVYSRVEEIVAEADSHFSRKQWSQALNLYLQAARCYRDDLTRKTENALASRRNAYDWSDPEVSFLGAHTYNRLGYLYCKGLGTVIDKEVGAQYYLLSEENTGSCAAQLALAEMFLIGSGVPRVEETAFGYYEKAAKIHENGDALYHLASMYESGLGVEANKKLAYQYYIKAAEKGNPMGQLRAGLFYEPDYEKAAHYYKLAMENGNTEATYRFGLILAKVHNNWADATMYFHQAAEQDHASALGALGLQYLEGRGLEKDVQRAVGYLRKGADLGDVASMYHLSQLYMDGMAVEKDEVRGLELLKKSALDGEPSALYQLGILYYKGKGVEKNISEAIVYFEKAAEGGNKKAKAFLDKAFNSK